jgi:hypothetical protein
MKQGEAGYHSPSMGLMAVLYYLCMTLRGFCNAVLFNPYSSKY